MEISSTQASFAFPPESLENSKKPENASDLEKTLMQNIQNRLRTLVDKDITPALQDLVHSLAQSVQSSPSPSSTTTSSVKQEEPLPFSFSLEEDNPLLGTPGVDFSITEFDENDPNDPLWIYVASDEDRKKYRKNQQRSRVQSSPTYSHRLHILQRQFVFLLFFFSATWAIVGTCLLNWAMPYVFFRPSDPFLAFCIVAMGLGFVNTRADQIFQKEGFAVVIYENRILFHPRRYIFQLLGYILLFSFLLLMDVRPHFQELPLEFLSSWNIFTNRVFERFFLSVPYMGIVYVQKILFDWLFFWTIIRIVQSVFKNPEVV